MTTKYILFAAVALINHARAGIHCKQHIFGEFQPEVTVVSSGDGVEVDFRDAEHGNMARLSAALIEEGVIASDELVVGVKISLPACAAMVPGVPALITCGNYLSVNANQKHSEATLMLNDGKTTVLKVAASFSTSTHDRASLLYVGNKIFRTKTLENSIEMEFKTDAMAYPRRVSASLGFNFDINAKECEIN